MANRKFHYFKPLQKWQTIFPVTILLPFLLKQKSGKLSSIVPFPLEGPIPKIDGDEYRAFKIKTSDEVR